MGGYHGFLPTGGSHATELSFKRGENHAKELHTTEKVIPQGFLSTEMRNIQQDFLPIEGSHTTGLSSYRGESYNRASFLQRRSCNIAFFLQRRVIQQGFLPTEESHTTGLSS